MTWRNARLSTIFSLIKTKRHPSFLCCRSLKFSTVPQEALQHAKPKEAVLLEAQRFEEVGVTETFGQHPKVMAIIKEAQTEFHIHEIGMDGEIVKLTEHNETMAGESSQDYIQCVMYKEGMDHTDGIRLIAKYLGIEPEDIYHAGKKDKTAVTSQRLTIPNLFTAQEIMKLCNVRKNLKLGNFSYTPNQLKIGDLKGNHFKILLKNVQLPTSKLTITSINPTMTAAVNEAVQSMKNKGHINYFDLQKFRNNSPESGAAMMQGNWKKAFDIILSPKPGESEHVQQAKAAWFSGQPHPAKIFNTIPAKFRESTTDERILAFKNLASHFKTLEDLPAVYQQFPESIQDHYLTGFTKFLWNQLVSTRLQKWGHEPIPGDMVLTSIHLDQPTDPSYAKDIEDEAVWKNVKVLTEKDLTPGHSWSIHDVLLPLPSPHTLQFPNKELQEFYEKRLAQNQLGVNCFSELKKKYPHFDVVKGSYRRMVVKPLNMSHKLIEYGDKDNLSEVMPSDLDELTKGPSKKTPKGSGGKKAVGIILEMSLPTTSTSSMALREIMQTANFDVLLVSHKV